MTCIILGRILRLLREFHFCVQALMFNFLLFCFLVYIILLSYVFPDISEYLFVDGYYFLRYWDVKIKFSLLLY